ncbi:MAG: hypothetical protein IH789_05010 [Acidobacteria bacterium]|nr:hypothetical protein [Acidobacteriota bacterium]
MTARATTGEVELIEVGGGDRGPASAEFRPGRGGDGGAAPLFPQRIYISGIVLALAAMLMFFLALASAYVVRKGLSGDWIPLGLPRILWLNTAVIIDTDSVFHGVEEFRLGGLREAGEQIGGAEVPLHATQQCSVAG